MWKSSWNRSILIHVFAMNVISRYILLLLRNFTKFKNHDHLKAFIGTNGLMDVKVKLVIIRLQGLKDWYMALENNTLKLNILCNSMSPNVSLYTCLNVAVVSQSLMITEKQKHRLRKNSFTPVFCILLRKSFILIWLVNEWESQHDGYGSFQTCF